MATSSEYGGGPILDPAATVIAGRPVALQAQPTESSQEKPRDRDKEIVSINEETGEIATPVGSTPEEGIKQRVRWVQSLLDSERPNNVIHGRLLGIGILEAKGLTPYQQTVKALAMKVARNSYLWTEEDIAATIEEGKQVGLDMQQIEQERTQTGRGFSGMLYEASERQIGKR